MSKVSLITLPCKWVNWFLATRYGNSERVNRPLPVYKTFKCLESQYETSFQATIGEIRLQAVKERARLVVGY